MNYEEEVNELLKNTDNIHLVAGLASECGEVCGLFQKASYKNLPVDENELELELGDVLFYATAIASKYGMSISDIQKRNIAKLKDRHGK